MPLIQSDVISNYKTNKLIIAFEILAVNASLTEEYLTKEPRWQCSQFALHADGLVFEFRPQQTQVIKTDSDSSPAKRFATGVSGMGPRR